MPRTRFIAIVACVALWATPGVAEAVGGEGQSWPAFTESSSCGAQRIPTPHADETGWLSRTDLLRGEFAAFFGRSVQNVHSELVRTTLPDSAVVVAVHPWVVPALELAATEIERTAATEGRYRITPASTYSTASRTIGGSIRISRHTFGTALDINATRNPHRRDNRLITDIPDWWTQSFLDAGFCWGGLWVGSKDTMHFAWQGPAFSGYDQLPLPYEPLTDPAPFGLTDRIFNVTAPTHVAFRSVLADTSDNGALDVVRLRTNGPHLVIDTSLASRRHNACASRTAVVANLADSASDAIAIGFGDWDGRGGQDLWLAHDVDSKLALTVRWDFGNYAAEVASVTTIPVPGRDAWISTGDFDVDGSLDLVIIDDGDLTVWDVDPDTGESSIQVEAVLPEASPNGRYSLADLDLDNVPDVWIFDGGDVTVATGADDWAEPTMTDRVIGMPSRTVDVAASDYDGDGRPDIIVFDGARKLVWLGNTLLDDGLAPEVWFEAEEPDCGEGERGTTRDELRFSSSGWVAQGSYEWRRSHGFPVGCDPEDDDCPVELVTHRMLAEFFAWIDGLEPFGSDPDTAAGRAVSHAGYAASCPVSNTDCWASLITPAELSARFGMFLDQRRNTGVKPHRWIIPAATRIDSTPLPH